MLIYKRTILKCNRSLLATLSTEFSLVENRKILEKKFSLQKTENVKFQVMSTNDFAILGDGKKQIGDK